MSERTLTVRLRAIVDGYEKAMKSAGDATDQFATRADRVTGIGDRAEATGKRMTTGLTVPIAAIGTAALFTAGNFEASMREVQALTGATAGEMAMLEGQATRMGAQTQFSASQAADALTQLIKGGFDVEQAYAALPGVMQLAAASSLDIASAADIATNVMSGFGLEVGQLTKVNDVLAQAANSSDTDVRELGEAFKMVGPIARGAGLSLEDTAGILALLAENGIRGTMAGTALRGMIGSLAAPTGPAAAALERLGVSVVDAQGQLLPMTDIVRQLNEAGASTTDIYRIFGREVAGGMSALLGTGAPALEQMISLLEESGGVAQNLADSKMGGLNGAVEQLWGSLESLAIAAGDAGAIAAVSALADGGTALANAMASVPGPVMGGALSIIALTAASGPAIWAFGKMATMYRPVITGAQDMVLKLMLLGEQFQLNRAAGMGWASALGGAFGPQAGIILGLVALGGALIIAKREIDNYRRSHLDAGDSAMQLADAAGITTREISALNDEADRGSVSTDDWRKSVEDTIITLRSLGSEDLQQSRLIEIGYEMVLRGASPEEAVDQVARLATAAGVELPVELNVANVDDFDGQVQSVIARAKVAATELEGLAGSDVSLTKDVTSELDAIAQAAANAWQTDNIAGFVQILGESGIVLGDNADAMNYLVDQALKYTDVAGLSTAKATDLASAFVELTGGASGASEDQKDLVDSIVATASAMDGGLTPANLAAAAALQTAGYSADEFGSQARAAAEGGDAMAGSADGMAGSLEDGAASSEDFAAAISQMSAAARIARIDLEAGAAAADAYTSSIEGSTTRDDVMASSLAAGAALRSLREGFYGTADGADELEDSTEETYTAVDRLSDAASRLDENLSDAGMRMGSLQAAADGFRRSIENSTGLDNQLGSALSVGEAWRDFATTVRRLPADLDLAAAASGKYRTRQSAAIQSVIDLGNASKDYLATLLETGASHNRVREESARMRAEFEQQLRQAGMNEDQIRRYVEVLGLTPAQVETAIKVSGEDAARFQIDSYLQLLQDRIPENVAASVVTSIEAGDLQSAAAQLASWARTNPVRIEVQPGVDERSAERAQEKLWELPADFDEVTAMLGRYTEEQQRGIDGFLALGDAAQEHLSKLIGNGEVDTAREHARLLREEYGRQIYALTGSTEAVDAYLEAMGLTPGQVETAIVLSGDAEAMFRIQAYSELLNGEIDPEVATKVIALIDEGQLDWAAAVLKEWRLDNYGEVPTGADLGPAIGSIEWFRSWIEGTTTDAPVDADTWPAIGSFEWFRGWISGTTTDAPVDADTQPAIGSIDWFRGWIASTPATLPVDVDLRLAEERLRATFGDALVPLLPGRVNIPPPQFGGRDGDPATPWAAGGYVSGPGTGTSDSIAARLSNGEFVMRAAATSAIGVDRLEMANRTGMLPGVPFAAMSAPLSAASANGDGRLYEAVMSLHDALGRLKPGITLNVPVETTDRPATMRDIAVQAKGVLYTEGLVDA